MSPELLRALAANPEQMADRGLTSEGTLIARDGHWTHRLLTDHQSGGVLVVLTATAAWDQ
jgi:hypothetical protein